MSAEFINLLLNFEGVIGAIGGSVATLVVTKYLKNKGTVKAYLNEISKDFYNYEEWGDRIDADYRSASTCKIDIELFLHNTTENVQPIKDIYLHVSNMKLELSHKIINRHGNFVDEVYDLENIQPGEIKKLTLFVVITESQLFAKIKDNDLTFEYSLPSKRIFSSKKLILSQ